MSIADKLGFTPGPWHLEKSGGFGGEGCEVPHSSCWCEEAWEEEDSTDESRANDKLMATSPEMLLSIIGMVDCAEKGEMGKAAKILHLMSEVIEKATGKTWEEVKELIKEK